MRIRTACEEGCKNEGFGITFEYSEPGTPQQNGVVERAFATLYGHVRAMMNHACFSKKARDDLWAECDAIATKLENLLQNRTTWSPHALDGWYVWTGT